MALAGSKLGLYATLEDADVSCPKCGATCGSAWQFYFGGVGDLPRYRLGDSIRWRAVDHLCAWYDTSIDWDDPAGPSPWSVDEFRRFEEATSSLLSQLRAALGPEFAIVDEHAPHEPATSGSG